MNYMLDACALIALLNGEDGADIVDRCFSEALSGDAGLYMHSVNYLEVLYGFYREEGQAVVDDIIAKEKATPLIIIDAISDDVFQGAYRLKGRYKCSLADAIGLSAAAGFNAQFVTADHHELEEVAAAEPIKFLWLPPRPKK
jgi:predicted nucleic acid-binding protein